MKINFGLGPNIRRIGPGEILKFRAVQMASSEASDQHNLRNVEERFYYVTQQRYIIIIIIILLLKYLSTVLRLLEGFNNTAFPHDLTSRPGFATANTVRVK
jgi:hypothetical protein